MESMTTTLLPDLRTFLSKRLSVPRNQGILLGASAGILQRFLMLGGAVLLLPIILNHLGQESFGIWGAVTSIGGLGTWLDLGIGSALVTEIAHLAAGERWEEARRLFGCALFLSLCLSSVVALAAITVLITSGGVGERALFAIAIAMIAINMPLSTSANVWHALQKGYVGELWGIFQTVTGISGLLLVCLYSHRVWLYVFVSYACIIAGSLASMTYLLCTEARIRPRLGLPTREEVRTVLRRGWLYFALSTVSDLSYILDTVLVLEWYGPAAAARMTILARICVTALSLLVVISQPLWPAFADAIARREHVWVTRCRNFSMALLVAITLVGSMILILWGEPLLHFWLRQDLMFSRYLLASVCFWILAHAINRTPNLLLNGLGIIRYQVINCSCGTTAALVLKYALGLRWQEAGILWGTALAWLVIVGPLNLLRIRRWEQSLDAKQSMSVGPA